MSQQQSSAFDPKSPTPNIQIAIHSSPRFSTWIWIPDWKILIDAGDGATQHLGYKIRKIDSVVCTHSHRDHIGGLLQVINQRGEAGAFALAHPCGSSSFKMLEAFSHKFNPGSSRQAIWHDLEEGDEIPGESGDRIIKAFRTRHYHFDEMANAPRSLGYNLLWRKAKVRAEYRDLLQAELDAVRLELGREGITEQVDEKWICVGGDGAPLKTEDAIGAKLLLHEATFLSDDDRDNGDEGDIESDAKTTDSSTRINAPDSHGHVHSTVEEALRVTQQAQVENVILYHVSTRYTDVQIRDSIKHEARKLDLQARVWVALPRRVYWNLLGERPVWG